MKDEINAQFWISAEEAHDLWKIPVTTLICLIRILTSLMTVYYIYRKKKEAENELAQMSFLIQSTESLMHRSRENVLHTQQMEEELRAEIWKEICSAKKIMDGEGRLRARLRNETFELKKAMKKRDEFYDDFEKNIDLLKKRIAAKKRLDIEFQNDIYSFQMMVLPQPDEMYGAHFQSQVDSSGEPTIAEHAEDIVEEVLSPGEFGDTQEIYNTEKEFEISDKPTIRNAVKAGIKSKTSMFPIPKPC
jgi:hypothetical protein